MVSPGQAVQQREGFFASVWTSIRDLRLWLIVLPSLVACGSALALFKGRLGQTTSIAIALIAGYLINRIETLPKPNEKELAKNAYRNVILPATVGILIIPSSDLLARFWIMCWHWFHAGDQVRPCWYLFTAALLGWAGIALAPAVTAVLTGKHAVFATVVGLMVYVPLAMTETFSGTDIAKAAMLISKSCRWDFDPSTDLGSFEAGMVVGSLVQALLAVFVAKVTATWLSRKSESANGV